MSYSEHLDAPVSQQTSSFDEFRSALANAKHIIVLAGAGLSAGSGDVRFSLVLRQKWDYLIFVCFDSRYPDFSECRRDMAIPRSTSISNPKRFCLKSLSSLAVLSSS